MREIAIVICIPLLAIPILLLAYGQFAVGRNGLPIGMSTAGAQCDCGGAIVLLSSMDQELRCPKCGKTYPLDR